MEADKIKTLIARTFSFDSIEKLYGDASDRSYYRILLENGESLIGQLSVDKEQFNIQMKSYRFLKDKIHIPEMIEKDEDNLLLFFEDVGNNSLFSYFQGGGDLLDYKEEIEKILRGFVELPRDDYLSPYQPYDWQKYLWGFNFFYKDYLKNERKIEPEVALRNRIYDVFEDISKYLDREDVVMIHRDFHSKNLFIKDDRLRVLDYQDLRVGNYFYDRISFLWDVYIDYGKNRSLLFPFQERDIYFMKLLAIQRLFKILGNFAYLKNEKDKPDYLKMYEGRIIGYLKELTEDIGRKVLYDVVTMAEEKFERD